MLMQLPILDEHITPTQADGTTPRDQRPLWGLWRVAEIENGRITIENVGWNQVPVGLRLDFDLKEYRWDIYRSVRHEAMGISSQQKQSTRGRFRRWPTYGGIAAVLALLAAPNSVTVDFAGAAAVATARPSLWSSPTTCPSQ